MRRFPCALEKKGFRFPDSMRRMGGRIRARIRHRVNGGRYDHAAPRFPNPLRLSLTGETYGIFISPQGIFKAGIVREGAIAIKS